MNGIEVSARTPASAEAVWALFADPAAWPRWAPHIRATRTARAGLVVEGDEVTIVGIPSLVQVTATITRVDAPRRWDFAVTPVPGVHLTGVHEIVERGDHRIVVVGLDPAGPLRVPARAALEAYRPIATASVRRLAALAEGIG